MNQYLYRIQVLRPEQLSEGATDTEKEITAEHFYYLQDLKEKGRLILAGRTQNTDYSSFGIIIFEAENDEVARKIMHNDPGVKKKLFRAELYPYKIALLNPNLQNLDK
ncbi:MAG TPA: YciI family protein [Aggregatilineales bacterium]|nr:YciI family protein [Aggregatilineales bacterium]